CAPSLISTHFPYTTLFRSKVCALDLWIHQEPTDVTQSFAAYVEKDRAFRDQLDAEGEEACRQNYHVGVQSACTPPPLLRRVDRRSEEHTSELQSRSDLVCR